MTKVRLLLPFLALLMLPFSKLSAQPAIPVDIGFENYFPLNGEENSVSLSDLRPPLYRGKNDARHASSFLEPARTKPGWALVSSAILPGSGQAANGKWVRAGIYLLAEAVTLTVHFASLQQARDREQRYEQFADNNWSVLTYAQWLVDYHDQNNLQNEFIDDLRNQVQGETPAYDTDSDWPAVDIELLRNVERNTPFVYPGDDPIGNPFSHVMPDYGSQQYYELISKYYQYGPGWVDFGQDRNGNPLDSRYQLDWNGSDMPFNFFRGANLAEQFNDKYRLAGNMLSLIILNHMVSAFDAFITVRLKNKRIETEANMLKPAQTFTIKYRF